MTPLRNRDSGVAEGWIWDLYPKDEGIAVWIKTRDGKCIRLFDEWQPSIYVSGEEHELIELADKPWIANRCELTRKFAEITDREESTVLRIRVRSGVEGRILAEKIMRFGGYRRYRLYNVDIPTPQLYMYEKNLFPLAYVEAKNRNDRLQWTILDSASSNRYEIPHLKRMTLKVEVESKATPSFQDPASKIHVGLREKLTIDLGSEAEKLEKLMEIVQRRDPDVIFTEDGNRFTLPYLLYRARVNCLSGFDLGREKGQGRVKGKGRVYFSYGRVYYRPRPFRLLGRLHVDLCSTLYAECGLQGLIEVARACRIPVQRAADSTIGTCMSSLQFYSAFRRGLLIPWRKGEPEDFKTARQLLMADRGGFCFEPKIGVHENVGEIDFDSLYPTLMVKYNLSPETINCDCCLNSSLRIPELGYHVCERRVGLIPEAIKPLLNKRREYKRMRDEERNPDLREVWDQRQAAIKWILVSSFGYLGYRNARFGRVEAHIATCALARDTLRKAFHLAEEHGFEVIHGIVDSLWLR
ncbi:MAG: DNA polymerase domain-containing protein, partial [Candidatus Bathyarchaeia archaeon]